MALDLSPAGTGRMVAALGLLAGLAVAVAWTMDAGRYRTLTWVLLGFFSVRVVLAWARSRKMERS